MTVYYYLPKSPNLARDLKGSVYRRPQLKDRPMFEQILTPQVMSVSVMFVITIVFGTVFWWPVTRFPRKDGLLNFYWVGFWAFLAMITAMSGAQATLKLAGQNVDTTANALLNALTITFVVFVVFAWFRLVLLGAGKMVTKIRR